MSRNLDSSSVVRAMDEAAPQNPYSGQIIHAAIQVESVEAAAAPDTALEPAPPSAEDGAEKERADNMRMWWNEAIAKNMNLPEGYEHVAVLIIKWADELDELKTAAEAQELEALFRTQFHYHTETVELNVKSKAQLQLNSRISSFAAEHNGPNHLLIVYYTGHGVYFEDKKFLQLAACANPALSTGLYQDAHANWNKAEGILIADDIDADCLTILDACYASNVTKSITPTSKKFELLSACGLDQTTAAPGPNSFTRALIDNLQDLLSRSGGNPFNTFHLNQRICMDARRRDSPSQIWDRLASSSNILLKPLPKARPATNTNPATPGLEIRPHPRPPRGYLTLRLALRDSSLNREQIHVLTSSLARAFEGKKMIGLRRIDWVGLRSARVGYFERVGLALFVVERWKRVVARRRLERGKGGVLGGRGERKRGCEDVVGLEGGKRKRGCEDDVELEGGKRRAGDATPPLTPTSGVGG